MPDNPESPEDVLDAVEPVIQAYFDDREPRSLAPDDDIPLNAPSYGTPEVMGALESLLSTWVSMGEKVYAFEDAWADYLGAASALMVNSGSSANLVMLKTLKNAGELEEGDEVIVPATTWSTTIAPILDVGCEPVLVDCDIETLNIDPWAVEEAITEDTAAILAVHLLGNPAPVGELSEIADTHDIHLLEDCCEAHGARWHDDHVGTVGTMGTYSFFFSHHICTMEGGMVVAGDDADWIEAAKPVRAHGWMRERDDFEEYADRVDWFDPRFAFEEPGMNVRPTELQGAFGLEQLDRLEGFIDQRTRLAHFMRRRIEPLDGITVPDKGPAGRHTYYGFPILATGTDTQALMDHLEAEGIETRPIMGGNLAKHPAFEDCRVSGSLTGSNHIHNNGIFVGNHHAMDLAHAQRIVEAVESGVGL